MKRSFGKFVSVILAFALMFSLAAPVAAAETKSGTQDSSDTVKIGAEVLLESEEWKEYLKGKNVALFTNQVCVDADMNHLADRLAADPDINLVCMFGGEHGLRGAYQAGAAVPHSIDATTGLPVWSLYNGGTIDTDALGLEPLDADLANPKNPGRPTLAMLTGNNGKWYDPVDVILFDLQEIGSKTWTYMYTLADCMTACVEATRAGHEVELIILDRPSTISSSVVEGTMTTPENASGISRYPLPSRYGLTMGELAKLYQGEGYKNYWTTGAPGSSDNEYGSTTSAPADWNWDDPSMENKISLADCKLTVIPCEGYTRDMYWDETGLQFILPSPNMPTWEAALIYTGTVWFEGPTIAEGRGTTKAFELISAPYIDPIALAERMNELELPGVRFRAASITPYSANQTTGANYVNQLCHGVQIHITDKRTFSPVEMQVALFLTLQAMYGGSGSDHFNMPASVDQRTGSSWVREEVQNFAVGSTTEQVLAKTAEMMSRMEDEMADYLTIREKYLMSEYDTPEGKAPVTTPQPSIDLGYEALLADHMDLLEGKKVGLVTNQTGVDKDLNHLADVLHEMEGVELTTLFSTQYGLRGEFQTAAAGDYTDNVTGSGTGLPVHRLYHTAPTAEQLADVEVLLFDLQDSGTRSNSYIQLMADCMLACAENNVTFVVLDRPNPLGGMAADGPVEEEGGYPIPTRYGMTLGEMALMIQGEFESEALENLDLQVIPMSGWTRDMYYSDTGLQYIMADRKIPTATTALTYASIGWLEGTGAWTASAADQKGVSVGWGTTKTYEFFGAPFIHAQMVEFAQALNDLDLPGVRFRMAAMTPWNNTTEEAAIKFPNTACYGVQLHIYDESAYSPVDTALGILTTLRDFFPEDVAEMFTGEFDEIVGNTWMAEAIQDGESAEAIRARFQESLDEFLTLRENYLLYGLDKTDLDAAIQEAEDKVQEDYTASSWVPFAEALEAAKAVRADNAATQEEIGQALEALRAAMENLTRETSSSTATRYAITVKNAENGTVESSRTRASRGASISLTVTPDDGYELDSLTVTAAGGSKISVHQASDTRYTFTMPRSAVTVEAGFRAVDEEPASELPFTDVDDGDWFYDAVVYAYANDLMNGTSGTTFAPSVNLSRAMVAQVLYNLEGRPEFDVETTFPDVPSGQWYTDAVLWAAANGIVTGYDTGRFGPDDSVTREQLAAMLYRYAAYKAYDVSGAASLDGYTDAGQISGYALTALRWANAEGLITGTSATTLTPGGTASRAEVATILMRFAENVAE